MNYEVKEQLYEGKAKQVFATNDPEIVMVHYKDDATAGDGEKKGTIRDKGIVNNKLSNALMQKLEKEGIPTHYVKVLEDGGLEHLSSSTATRTTTCMTRSSTTTTPWPSTWLPRKSWTPSPNTPSRSTKC